jgi:hypothetical protein
MPAKMMRLTISVIAGSLPTCGPASSVVVRLPLGRIEVARVYA